MIDLPSKKTVFNWIGGFIAGIVFFYVMLQSTIIQLEFATKAAISAAIKCEEKLIELRGIMNKNDLYDLDQLKNRDQKVEI